MIKRLLPFLAVTALTLFFALGCPPSNQPEFVGTWTMSAAGQAGTLVFTAKTLHMETSGLIPATLDFSIVSVDENANHIEMKKTGGTGLGAAVPNGTTYYMLYSIIGNTMMMAMDTAAYPSAPTADVYTKQ